jgi:adenine deaminase
VAQDGKCLFAGVPISCLNQFVAKPIVMEDLAYTPAETEPVIVCLEGQLITNREEVPAKDCIAANDCLKLVVMNRYVSEAPAIAYIKNFGLKSGAIAGSVAHDSHNIIAVGTTDADICKAINLVIAQQGALVACNDTDEKVLPLPLAGLMSNAEAWQVANAYTQVDDFSKKVLGATLQAPFMSLSFMALLVIPHLKLSNRGLFDGDSFSFVRN